jgi:hypothetical protein
MEHLASGNIKSEHEKAMIMHGFGTTLDASFDDAIDRVTNALGKAGLSHPPLPDILDLYQYRGHGGAENASHG